MYFKCPYSNFYMFDYRFRPDAPEQEFINKIDSNEKLFYERLAKLESKIELFSLQADTIKKAHENVIKTSEFVKEAAQLHSEAAESSFITNILLSIIDGIGILFGIPKTGALGKFLIAIVKKLSNKHSANTVSKTNDLLDKADKLNYNALEYLKNLKADIACKDIKEAYNGLEIKYADCQEMLKKKFTSELMANTINYQTNFDQKNNFLYRLDYSTDVYMDGKTVVRAVKWQTSPAFSKDKYRNLTFEIRDFKYTIEEYPQKPDFGQPKCYNITISFGIAHIWQEYNSETKTLDKKEVVGSCWQRHTCLIIPSNFKLELANKVIEYE